jgi:N-methylhydantoinase A/oxoprolinase/acetone carboxylase beta subunit
VTLDKQAASGRVRIAVDIGGTFTDLQVVVGGQVFALKTPTTPADPSDGLFTGMREAARRFGFELGEADLLMHGTTIATNAVLERKLPPGALITTAGFEDVLEIGRHFRRDVYGLKPEIMPVLVPRDRRLGVAERIRGNGEVELALDDAAIEALAAKLDRLGVECAAICLINAFVNAAHEERLRDALARRLPGLQVSISSEVSPEIREFERTSTTVLNALLMPVVQRYTRRLTERLASEGLGLRIFLVQSNGGVCSLDLAGAQPARLLLSGPSGGALAAQRIAAETGFPNLVAVDMGGTSFDVSIVQDGASTMVMQGEVDSLPVRLPMVEIRTIGAGGGSIAHVAAGGRLEVGPESAGAMPGPVCYRRGGTEPTVTDANLALGRLDAASFLSGEMSLDLPGARSAMARVVAEPLGVSIDEAAEGVLAVANAKLAAATRLSLFEKGLDPRDFAMLSFGGAGGLHAVEVAEAVGIRRVIFPRNPSTLSAWGILHSDIVQDFARSRVLRLLEPELPAMDALIGELRAASERFFAEQDIAPADRGLSLAADVRYVGQAFEILTPWRREIGLGPTTGAELAVLLADFHAAHRQRFSYADPDAAVEVVTLRLTATGRVSNPKVSLADAGTDATAARTRPIYMRGALRDVPVVRREGLAPRATIAGPAVIEEGYTTLIIDPGWSARVDPHGNIVAETGADS